MWSDVVQLLPGSFFQVASSRQHQQMYLLLFQAFLNERMLASTNTGVENLRGTRYTAMPDMVPGVDSHESDGSYSEQTLERFKSFSTDVVNIGRRIIKAMGRRERELKRTTSSQKAFSLLSGNFSYRLLLLSVVIKRTLLICYLSIGVCLHQVTAACRSTWRSRSEWWGNLDTLTRSHAKCSSKLRILLRTLVAAQSLPGRARFQRFAISITCLLTCCSSKVSY